MVIQLVEWPLSMQDSVRTASSLDPDPGEFDQSLHYMPICGNLRVKPI